MLIATKVIMIPVNGLIAKIMKSLQKQHMEKDCLAILGGEKEL